MEILMRYLSVFVLTSVALIGVAYAHDGKPSTEYEKCLNRAGAVDPEALECMSAEFTRQDKRLNTAYQKLMSALSPAQKKRLQEAQRLWVKYTEANCAFYYDPDGGTSARQSSNQCEIDARAARAAELETLKKSY